MWQLLGGGNGSTLVVRFVNFRFDSSTRGSDHKSLSSYGWWNDKSHFISKKQVQHRSVMLLMDNRTAISYVNIIGLCRLDHSVCSLISLLLYRKKY